MAVDQSIFVRGIKSFLLLNFPTFFPKKIISKKASIIEVIVYAKAMLHTPSFRLVTKNTVNRIFVIAVNVLIQQGFLCPLTRKKLGMLDKQYFVGILKY